MPSRVLSQRRRRETFSVFNFRVSHGLARGRRCCHPSCFCFLGALPLFHTLSLLSDLAPYLSFSRERKRFLILLLVLFSIK